MTVVQIKTAVRARDQHCPTCGRPSLRKPRVIMERYTHIDGQIEHLRAAMVKGLGT